MAEKIDELLSSFNEFKATQIAAQQAQQKNQQDLAAKFDQLQKEVVAGQEETAQMMAKKLKRGPDYQFHHKGNEKQFLFNDSVNDTIQLASTLLEKVKPSAPQDAALLKTTTEQLLEGTECIKGQQNLIRIADLSE